MHVLEAHTEDAPRASLALPSAIDSLVFLRGRAVDSATLSVLRDRVTVFCDELAPSLPDYFSAGLAPVASRRFVDALVSLGVDNHETFLVSIEDIDDEIPSHGYSALNVSGRIACIDLDRSRYTTEGGAIFRVDTLRLRDDQPSDVLMFRPHEWPRVILINDVIAERLKGAGLTGVKLTPLNDWTYEGY